MTKEEIIKKLRDMAKYPTVTLPRDCDALKAAADLLAQPEQEPVQVSVLEFVEMVFEKEHLVGRPIVWAQWPSKE